MKKVMIVEGMKCAHCSKRVEDALKAVEDVKSVSINLGKKQVVVALGSDVADEKLSAAVEGAGYTVTSVTVKKGLFS